jgi:ABC-type Mn2+/Zn2+ transport system ATPase subunit
MSGSPETLVRLTDASVGYNGAAVLEQVNLEIRRGSFVALLGPNGAGKSTLMKTIVGILPVLTGKLDYPSGTPRFGYVPQRDTLDPVYPLTAFEVVLMGTYGSIRPFSVVKGAMRARAMQALRDARAEPLAGRLFADLSGGERQRVLIARALATDPECLVLDEPVAGIDQPTTEAIIQLATALNRNGMTILLVSHHLATLRGRVDEVVWIAGQKVVGGPAAAMLSTDKLAEMLISEKI